MNTLTSCDELSSRTYFALGHTTRLARSLQSICVLLWDLPLMPLELRSVIKLLRDPTIENCDRESISEVINNLVALNKRTTSMLDAAHTSGFSKKWVIGYLFEKVRLANDDLYDTLENLVFSNDTTFRQSIEKAISGLNTARSPNNWRSSLAEMRD